MKFTAPYLLSNEDLEGVKASLHVDDTNIDVEAEVEVFTLDQYRAIGKVDLEIGEGESDGLLVALVTAEFPDVDANTPCGECAEMYNLEYRIGQTSVLRRQIKLDVGEYEVGYTRLSIDGSTVSVQSYPGQINADMLPNLSDVIEEKVDAVVFGLCNPFIRCDVSKLKSIEIARDVRDSMKVKERLFMEYCRILNGIFRDYGADAFESLKRISGTYSELNYFFKLFSNRKLECIHVTDDPSRLKVEDLYTDFLCFGKNTNITRPSIKYGEILKRWGLPMRRTIIDYKDRMLICPKGEDYMKGELVDLRCCKVSDGIQLEYEYKFEEEGDPMDEDDVRTVFFLTLEFNRLKSPKSATFR